MKLLAALLLVLASAPRRAEAAYCRPVFNAIAEDAARVLGREVSCADVERASGILKLEGSEAGGAWSFAGETDLRDALDQKHGVAVPQDVLPLGSLERKAPSGPKVLVVFGLAVPRRAALIPVLSRLEEPVAAGRMAEIVGEGVWYNRVGFFVDEDGQGYPKTGVWKKFKKGGMWGRHQPRPAGVRECLPCRGWLCPADPLACFSDFNGDGAEEIHLTDDCGDGRCGLALFSPDGKGGVSLLFNAVLTDSAWEERPEGWVLMTKPKCRGLSFCSKKGVSLGDPTCVRPDVYVFRRGGAKVETSQRLKDAVYPVKVRPLPKGCTLEGREQLVWSPENGFILYEK